MKKLFNTIVVYLSLALAGGVFFREFTKFNDFTGKTYLSLVHTHLFILGFILFIIVLFIAKSNNELLEDKLYKRFYLIHNVSIGAFTSMFLVRGILQVLGTNLTNGLNSMISGIAGLTHIMLTISLVMFILLIKKHIISK